MKILSIFFTLSALFLSTTVLAGGTGHGHSHSHSHDSKAKEPAAAEKQAETQAVTDSESADWQDTVMVTIPAKGDKEYKVQLTEGQTFTYIWEADNGELFFDFHGEPKGDTTGYFKSFEKDTRASADGTLTAEFEGTHGWYWKNDSASPVEITLKLKGEYARLDQPVNQEVAEAQAQIAIASLVKRGKLAKSWESVTATSAETKEFNGNPEWVVIFDNKEIAEAKKQRLYIFLQISGQYIAANYTGQ